MMSRNESKEAGGGESQKGRLQGSQGRQRGREGRSQMKPRGWGVVGWGVSEAKPEGGVAGKREAEIKAKGWVGRWS